MSKSIASTIKQVQSNKYNQTSTFKQVVVRDDLADVKKIKRGNQSLNT
jgi:hypothetical protein